MCFEGFSSHEDSINERKRSFRKKELRERSVCVCVFVILREGTLVRKGNEHIYWWWDFKMRREYL